MCLAALSPQDVIAVSPLLCLVLAVDGGKLKRLYTLLYLLLGLGSLVAFAEVSSTGFQHGWIGWIISTAVFIVSGTGLAAAQVRCHLRTCNSQTFVRLRACGLPPFSQPLQWFRTLTPSASLVTVILLTVAAHIGLHVSLLVEFSSWPNHANRSLAVVFSFCLYPSAALFLTVRPPRSALCVLQCFADSCLRLIIVCLPFNIRG